MALPILDAAQFIPSRTDTIPRSVDKNKHRVPLPAVAVPSTIIATHKRQKWVKVNPDDISFRFSQLHSPERDSSYREGPRSSQKNTAINNNIIATLQSFRSTKGTEWAYVCNQSQKDFDAVNYSTTFNVCAKGYQRLNKEDRKKFLKEYTLLLNHLAQEIATNETLAFSGRAISNLVWGCAKLNFHHAGLYGKMAALAIKILVEFPISHKDAFNSPAMSNLAWAFAKQGIKAPELYESIKARALQLLNRYPVGNLEALSPKNISNLAWAFAKQGIKAPELYESIKARALQLLDTYPVGNPEAVNPQSISNLAWAFAKQGIKAPELYESIKARALQLLDTYPVEHPEALNSQDISNLAWAFAKQDIEAPELYESIRARALQLLNRYPVGNPEAVNHKNISNLAWAFAKQGIKAPELYESIKARALQLFDTYPVGNPEALNSQDISNLACTFAKQDIAAPELYESIKARALQLLDTYPVGNPEAVNPQSISNLAWAFAKQGIKAPELYESIKARALQLLDTYPVGNPEAVNPQSISNLAWAFASQDIEAPELYESIKARALQLLDTYPVEHPEALNSQDISNLAWSFEVNYIRDAQLSQLFAKNLNLLFVDLKEADLAQIHEICLAQNKEFSQSINLKVESAIQKILINKKNNPPSSSLSHRKIQTKIEEILSRNLESEFFVEGYFLDIVLDAEKKIAIEIDGPWHYLSDGSLPGSAILRDIIFQKLGWRIAHLNLKEFEDSENSTVYLKHFLAEIEPKALEIESATDSEDGYHSAHEEVYDPTIYYPTFRTPIFSMRT